MEVTYVEPDCVGLVTESQAAAYLSIGFYTLAGRRKRGLLPSGLVVRPSAHRIGYRLDLLRRWVELSCPPTWPAGEPRLSA